MNSEKQNNEKVLKDGSLKSLIIFEDENFHDLAKCVLMVMNNDVN